MTDAEYIGVTANQLAKIATDLKTENAKLREVIDDITEVVEVSDPALVEFIAKRMQRVRIEVTDD